MDCVLVPRPQVEAMTKLIAYDPDDRVSARQALRYTYFRELRQAEKKAAAQAQALAIASSQHSTPSATPRATQGAAPSPAGASSTGAEQAGKASRATRQEDRDSSGAAAKAVAPEPAPSAASTSTQRRSNAGITKEKRASGASSNLPNVGKRLVHNQAKDAESISSLPPIKSSQLSQNLSKTWSNSSWKSWKSSSSKAQKWNHQSSIKAARQPGGGGTRRR
jgi:hypothetical protein|eukprot:COSAG01_NODE_4958_length_4589_cov_21.366370_4_plen_221_part_00